MDMYMLQQRTAQQAQFGPPPGTLQAGSGRPVTALDAAKANDVFDHFLNAGTLKSILGHYRLLCDLLHLRPSTLPNFYPKLKQHLTSWRAKAVWKKFDGRANNKVYGKGRLCPDTRVLIIGAGPCGLRSAIEAQMLGAKVVVVEKRDRMSRNNVLHLWPFVIDDLRSLGAKKFFGKFCAGSIDHISIRQLQCILLKVALLLGIEIHTEVSFESLVEPSAENKRGWRASVKPVDHPVAQYEFDVIIAADGKRNTLQGFKRKEFRGKLAIAITANFINKRTEAEARVEEISGVAFIFNQKFFKDLYAETQIDLENIVYYKDDTHYFVMTAKKASLISKGVIRADLGVDTALLLAPENVDRARLMSYAREAAEFSTSHQMPDLEFAVNHYGQPDVAMFDFTSMYAAENASRVVEREGYRLLCILVGDSLLEPFWPTGSGCARGFLSSLDAAWAIRAWGSGACPLTVLAERESIYRLLGGTTPENLHRDSKSYTLEPSSRYPKLNRQVLTSHQVVGLYDTDDVEGLKARTQIEEVELAGAGCIREAANKRRKVDEVELLCWIKKQVIDYNVQINDLSESTFKDGKILCAILHHYRPDLVDYKDLPEDDLLCNHIAIELLEKEIGISSTVTPSELANMECTRSQLITYLSLIYETFKREIAHINHPRINIIPEIPVPTPKRFRNVKLNPSPAILKMGIQLNGKCERRLKVKSVNTLGRKNDIDIILENKSEQLVEESTKILEEPKLNLQEVEVIPSERLNCSVPADNVIEVPMSNDKFKDKLLFGYPNIIIKSEDQDQTSYLKLWSVSDYLLIVPKTFACVVNYISNTGNNKQITKFTTTQPDCNCTFSTEEIELKDGCACCNIKKRFDELETVDKISIGADNTLDNVVKSCSRSHIDQIKSQLIENGLTLDRGDFVGERNLILNKCDNAEFTKRDIATYELTTDELVTQEERCDGNIALRNNIKVENIECTCQPLTNNDNLVCFHMALKHLKHMCRFQNVENINKSNGIDSLKCTCNYKDTINDKYPNGTCTCDIPNNFAINDNNLACLKRACPCDANLDKFCTEENCQCCGELRSNPQSINFNHFDNPIVECETIAHLSISTHKRNLVSPLQSTTHVAQTSARHRRSWQLSKVLKYGAGRHTTMHKQPQLRCTTSKHRTTTGRQHSAPSSVSDRIRTWLYTSDFERASVITTVARRGEEDRQQGQQQQDNLADNCTDITGLTSVTKSPPLFCMPTGSTRTGVGRGGEGRIVVESQRTILRFGADGEPVKGIHKRVHEHRSPTSSKHSSPPKHHQSPSRLPCTHSPQSNFSSTHSSSPASPPEPHSSQPSYVSRAPTPVVVSSNTSPPPIQVKKAVEEEEEDDSNHSMEELAARLLNRFRGEVVGEGSSVGMGGGGGGGGKPRVIQTVSNPFSAITEREDDEILPEMPELKQRTAAPTTGGINAISDPMHHRNFAGLRATPLGAALAAPATVAPTSRPHHHHVRQAVPLGAARPVAAAPAAAAESDRVRGRKRKSAAGGGVGPSSTMGLAVARFECRQEIAENRADRQTRRRHHRRMQTEQFLKSMQMLQGNCKPDHSEPFEDYSLFVYRQTAPNFGDRVRDLEKTFIYVPVNGNNDRDPSRVLPTQQKGERDEDFAARIRELEDKWYEPAVGSDKKPKDLMRAIGKIETSDWNIREIEKKIRENRSGKVSRDRERVPKWSREQFVARQTKMEKKHQLDRQDSTNAKYTELDKNLKLLDQRLKEGTVRDLNQHKIAKITEKLKPKDQKGDANIPKSNSKQSVVVPTATNSEQCIFCSKRVYLMEKLSAENCCFHRNCFRCAYCHTILRAGAYKYDADGKYGHRFYCNHHYGFSGQLPTLQSRRGPGAPPVGVGVTNTTPPSAKPAKDQMMDQKSSSSPLADGASGEVSPSTPLVAPREGGLLGRVSGVDLLDRVQTPERIEFSNLTTGNASSDHEESLSIMDEDEWTDRNFGASTAEVGSSDDEDSYSDSDSEEEYEEAIEEPPTKEGNMRILERYSRFSKKHDSDSEEYSSSEQSSYCENTSGDEESDTATEGEDEILARELRKQEVRLEPPIITDNGTDTEINSDDTAYSKSNEAPNSATEISTDSEFAQDEPTPTREIPSIVFNDAFVTKTRGTGNVTKVQVTTTELRKHNVPNAASNGQARQPPKKDHFVPIVPNNIPTLIAAKKPTNLPLLNRLTDGFPLNRTQSTSGIAAMRSLELKKRYLLGETAPSTANSIQKSGSASTLDSKLKSFHSNISDCQKMLNPTAEVSSSMQVFCDKLKSPVEGAIPAVTSVTTVDTSVKTAVTSVKTAVTSVKTAVTTVSESIQNDAKSKPTSITDVPKASAVQSKPKENGNVAPEQFHNELEGRPRSPVHETSIIVPKIDWASQSKPPEYTDSVSSDSADEELEVQVEIQKKISEIPQKASESIQKMEDTQPKIDKHWQKTVEIEQKPMAAKAHKAFELELLDSLNYTPSLNEPPKSISSEKKTLNQPKTLPGLQQLNKTDYSAILNSGRSTPTHGNDSCITGCLTETELSDWARDGAVSDDFDYEYEHVSSRRNKEPKKLAQMATKDEDLKSLGNELEKSLHVCGKTDIIECVNSVLNPNLENIEFMDTGSESSCSDEGGLKNNGYVQFYNDNDIAEDSLSPVINNIQKMVVIDTRNPLMTATVEDFDELSTPTKNTGFCEVMVTPTSGNNFGGAVIDLKPIDLEHLKQKQSIAENEMDSLQVIDTGTEDNTCSDSTVKNVEVMKPYLDNNNTLDKRRLEDKLMQVKQDMMKRQDTNNETNKEDTELYVEHCQRLQSKVEFNNVRDSIDVRKGNRTPKPTTPPKPDLIREESALFTLTPTTKLYQKEVIAKERDINQRLVHEMILNKYKTENKTLERKKRSRNTFSPITPKPFELSKSATTDLTPCVNSVTPDVLLTTPHSTYINPIQKSQTMAEISNQVEQRYYDTPSPKQMAPPQQIYSIYQVQEKSLYDTGEKIRQDARTKAKLMSDTDLGLSPEDKILRLRERIRGFESTTPQKGVTRTNSNIVRDTKSGLLSNSAQHRNSVAETQFNRINIFGTSPSNIYSNDTLSKKRNKSFRRSQSGEPELTTSKSVNMLYGNEFVPEQSTSGGARKRTEVKKTFKSDSNLLLDKCEDKGAKKKSKDRERRKSITKVISDFFVSIKKDGNSNLNAAKGFLAKISPRAKERSKSCINLPRENLVKEPVLRKSASSDVHFARDASPPPVPPLPENYTGNKLEDSSDAELEFRHCSLDNIDPALPDDTLGNTGSRRNSRGTVKRSTRQAQLKRHRTAQEIQRKLEETEVKVRDLELHGVGIEKRLRGERSSDDDDSADYASGSKRSSRDSDTDLLRQWFGVMRDLTEWRRYERELVTRAEELELEDRHARLQNQLRDKLGCDTEGGSSTEAGTILEEMMEIVAKRDSIIANLEQDKQRYTDEDKEFEEQMIAKGLQITPRRTSIEN